MTHTTEQGNSSQQDVATEFGLEAPRQDLKIPRYRANFYRIVHVIQYKKFVKDVYDLNEHSSIPTISKGLMDEAWMMLCKDRLDVWDHAANWPQSQKDVALQRAMRQTKSERALRLWAERAAIAGNPSLADESPMLDISLETLQDLEGLVGQTEGGNDEGEDNAAVEEQAALFAQSRARVQGRVGGEEQGEPVDAEGDVIMG